MLFCCFFVVVFFVHVKKTRCASVYPIYNRTSMSLTSLGPWKFVRDMRFDPLLVNHGGRCGQEAKSYHLGESFRFST